MPSNCKLLTLTRHKMHDMLTVKPRPEIQVMILGTSREKSGMTQVVSDFDSSTIWGTTVQQPATTIFGGFGPFLSCCLTQRTAAGSLAAFKGISSRDHLSAKSRHQDTKTLCKILYGYMIHTTCIKCLGSCSNVSLNDHAKIQFDPTGSTDQMMQGENPNPPPRSVPWWCSSSGGFENHRGLPHLAVREQCLGSVGSASGKMV